MSPCRSSVFCAQRGLQVLAGDAVLVRQHVHALERGHVDQHAARHQRREFLDAGALPAAIAQMFVGAKAVPDLAVDAEVVERVDVRAGVAVHGKGRAGVAAHRVHVLAHAHGIVDLGAARRVGHPELIAGIAGVLPAGHAHVVLGGQVIDLAAGHARHDGGARFGRDQVQPANFVIRAPGADADLLAGSGRARRRAVRMGVQAEGGAERQAEQIAGKACVHDVPVQVMVACADND